MPHVTPTDIPGLLVIDLPVHEDERGWFKEAWQRAKLTGAGLPDFGPVQHNLSFNASAGTTRGFHAEPWDKLVSVATGRVFGAWIDLREGPTFGRLFSLEVDRARAVFVPRGVGNAFQALEDGTCYSILANDPWSSEAVDQYTFTTPDHPDVEWPIPLTEAVLSDADRNHPALDDVTPVPRPKPLVIGGDGPLAPALRAALPDAVFADELDASDANAVEAHDFSGVSVIINAGGWTDADGAEGDARAACWAANVTAPANLTAVARRHRLPLVHISSCDVFDGTVEEHDEDEQPSPLSALGHSQAAGDTIVSGWPHHYILRAGWLVADGPNFARTMAELADAGESPSVVDDELGRLTFAEDLAAAVQHLLTGPVPYGTYNVASDGEPMSRYDIACAVFEARGASGKVAPTSTEEHSAGGATAPRPRHATLALGKIKDTGFSPTDGREALSRYLEGLED